MDGVSALNNFASMLHGPIGDAIFSHPIITQASVSGNAVLQAFGSASPSEEFSFDDAIWPTWDGRLMAAIRMNCDADSGAKVSFEVDGCENLVIELICQV